MMLSYHYAIEFAKEQKEVFGGDMNAFLDVAIECIEKQIPKKPILEADGYADDELVYDTWICPNCDKSYEVDYDSYNFCPNCGQAIDWSDEEAGEQE